MHGESVRVHAAQVWHVAGCGSTTLHGYFQVSFDKVLRVSLSITYPTSGKRTASRSKYLVGNKHPQRC